MGRSRTDHGGARGTAAAIVTQRGGEEEETRRRTCVAEQNERNRTKTGR